MTVKKFDLKSIKAQVATVADTGADLTKPQVMGEYKPPEAGPTRLRLTGYIEVGTHSSTWKGVTKTKPRCQIIYELSGPKHAPRVLDDGRTVPHVITIKETIGYTAKNGYIRLFNQHLGECPSATSFPELIGEAFRGTVVHSKSQDGQRTFAKLKGDAGYTITGTTYEDAETGEARKVKVADAVGDYRLFLWDNPSLEQWDSLFIDGQYDNGDSKNKFQEEIKNAENFQGSPIYNLLIEAGREAETVPAVRSAKPEAEDEEQAPAPEVTKAAKPKAKPSAATIAEDDDPLSGL